MTTTTRVRLTRWGKDHLVDGKETFCKLRVVDAKTPRNKALCIDCKREAHRRDIAVLQELT